ncbi:hypothetical protein [Corynebacterium belfantii]
MQWYNTERIQQRLKGLTRCTIGIRPLNP